MSPESRAAARNRVKQLTGWIAATAAVLTAGFVFGAARNTGTVKAASSAPAAKTSTAAAPSTGTQTYDDQMAAPATPPSTSYSPPAAASGGS